jgi:hypothetical protein
VIRFLVILLGIAGAALSLEFATRSVGIETEVQTGSREKKWIPEANGAGVAVLDYDRDGRMDLAVVSGASMETLKQIIGSQKLVPRRDGVRLYRNAADGKFVDVTRTAGLSNPFWGTGINVSDYDNDGFADILLTNIGQDVLYRNLGNGTFEDVSRAAGLQNKIAWHTGSAFGDVDGDGDLDLYIAGYVNAQSLGFAQAAPICRYLETPVFCGPLSLKGEPDVFYRNNGDKTFSEDTAASGLSEKEPRYGFTVVMDDFNGDGKTDIFVANDSAANYLFLNEGQGRFKESALLSGVAYNADGKSQANMGVAVGDFDNDGDVDLLTTTFSEDYFPLFEQVSPGLYEEVSARAGLVRSTTPLLGWGCGFVDFNNDGWRDLWLANGHVYPTIGQSGRTTYEQPIVVIQNQQGTFSSGAQVIEAAPPGSWRGGASGDFNNDGKLDLVIAPVDGKPLILENHYLGTNHWLGIDLQGKKLGSIIRVEGCGKTWFDTVRNGGSYLSIDDPRRHFGLGNCKAVDRVTISSLSGVKQTIEKPAIDRYHLVP